MGNFSIIAKGKYSHKQTSELLEVTRYLIVRKKKGRVLLLNLNNRSKENLTAMCLRIEQFDARGNSLGNTTVNVDALSVQNGEFVLKKEIAVHRACIDFRADVLSVEYGNYVYRLGSEDTFVTYEKPVQRTPVDKKKMRKKLGNRNFLAKRRKLSTPLFVSLFLGVLLCLTPAFIFLQTVNFDNNRNQQFHLKNVLYEFTDSNYNEKTPVNVIGYDGVGGQNIVIPATLDGHPVKAVKAEAFKQNLFIESLTVASGVEIEARAFAECPFLKKVVLQGTAIVREEAFYNCDSLVSVQAQNVQEIGAKAFYDCSALKSVRIESKKDEGSMRLGEKAFGRCGSFDEIVIKRFIEYTEKCDYFQSAFKVDTLYLQNYNYAPYATDEVVDRQLNALFGGIEVDVKKVHIVNMDGIPADFTKDCEDVLESVKIEKMQSKKIGDRAFLDCEVLKSLSLPFAVEEIGESGFENSGISALDLASATELGINAFKDCENLKEITTSVKVIENATFAECPALEKATLLPGVEKMEYAAFALCPSLKEVSLPQGLKEIGNAVFNCKNASLERIVIPASVEHIGQLVFIGCPLKEIVFEETSGWRRMAPHEFNNNEEGEAVDISDPAQNVSYFTEKYPFQYWVRSEVTE